MVVAKTSVNARIHHKTKPGVSSLTSENDSSLCRRLSGSLISSMQRAFSLKWLASSPQERPKNLWACDYWATTLRPAGANRYCHGEYGGIRTGKPCSLSDLSLA